TRDGVDEPEEIRIERRLIEDFVPQPVAGCDLPGPLVVAPGVAQQRRVERRTADLPHVDESNEQRDREDNEREPRTPVAGIGCFVGLSSVHSRIDRCGFFVASSCFGPRHIGLFSGQRWYASPACSEDGTAEAANVAEKNILGGLGALCGSFLSFSVHGRRSHWLSRR